MRHVRPMIALPKAAGAAAAATSSTDRRKRASLDEFHARPLGSTGVRTVYTENGGSASHVECRYLSVTVFPNRIASSLRPSGHPAQMKLHAPLNRLIAALLLLAAPLAVAAWGSEAIPSSGSARTPTRGSSAASIPAQRSTAASSRMRPRRSRQASERRVQLELLRGGRGCSPGEWIPAVTCIAGTARFPPQPQSATSPSSRRVAGSAKSSSLPLGRSLVGRLTSGVGLAEHQRLGFARGAELVGLDGARRIDAGKLSASAADIRTGGLRYRAVSEALGRRRAGRARRARAQLLHRLEGQCRPLARRRPRLRRHRGASRPWPTRSRRPSLAAALRGRSASRPNGCSPTSETASSSWIVTA